MIIPTHLGQILSFKIFKGPLFHKPVTGQELLLEARYVKEALIVFGQNFKNLVIVYRLT